jgi:hypothetical protein
MAELTVLEEKLAEVLGLAMAAQGATGKIRDMTDDEDLLQTLDRIREEAEQTEERCGQLQLADERIPTSPPSLRTRFRLSPHEDDAERLLDPGSPARRALGARLIGPAPTLALRSCLSR